MSKLTKEKVLVGEKKEESVVHKLKIMSYNINFGFSGVCENSQKIYEAIEKADSDIVCLQETHQRYHKIMRKLFRKKYPYYIFKEPEEYVAGGNEIFSKYPLRLICHEYPKDEDGLRLDGCLFRQVIVEVFLPNNETMYLLNLHLRPGVALSNGVFDNIQAYFHGTDVIRKKEFLHFWEKMESCERKIIVGDFNEGHYGRTIKYLKKEGYVDSAKNATTWYWPLKFGIDAFGSYDHIFSHKDYFKNVKVDVMKEYKHVSDHIPVVAELEILESLTKKRKRREKSNDEESEGEEEEEEIL